MLTTVYSLLSTAYFLTLVLFAPFWQNWQIAVGDLFELIRPAVFLLAAFLSAWVFADARRRDAPSHITAIWTLGTFFLPHILFPLYLALRIFTNRRRPTETPPTPSTATSAELSIETPTPETPALPDTSTPPDTAINESQQHSSHQAVAVAAGILPLQQSPSQTRLRRALLPALYFVMLLALGFLFFYRDYASVEGHLERAANARLLGQRERAIREYRAALRLEDHPHTRKLLALELFDAGHHQPALDEFLSARRGGEPDDALAFRLALTLDALNRSPEAALSYQEFLQSPACTQASPDPLCAEATERLQAARARDAEQR